MERNCTTCIYFESFRDSYEDELEPEDQGFCRCKDSSLFGNKGAGEEECCSDYLVYDLSIYDRFLNILGEIYGSDVSYHENPDTVDSILKAMYKAYNLDR